MTVKLFFDLRGKLFWFTCETYKLEDDFYIFIDQKEGKERRYHKSLFRGEENA